MALRTTRQKICLLVGLILALVIAAFWLRSKQHPSLTLANGSQLSFRAVAVGKESTYYFGSPLTRLIQKLPDSLRNQLPRGQLFQYSYDATNLVFWMEIESRGTNSPTPQSLKFLLEDEQDSFRSALPSPVIQRLPNGRGALCLNTLTWPRTAQNFVLKAYDDNLTSPSRLVGQWTIRNPAVVPPAAWVAHSASLPVSQPMGETEILLETFEIRPVPAMMRMVSGTNWHEPVAFISLRSTNRSHSSAAPWQLIDLRITDPMGNRFSWRSHADYLPNRLLAVVNLSTFGPACYQVESAWNSREPYLASEITNVVLSLSRSGNASTIGEFASSKFEIYTSRLPEPSGWSLMLSGPPRTPAGDLFPQALLIEVSDERGRRWKPNTQGLVTLPDDVQTPTAAVAVRPLKMAVFTATPVQRSSSLPTRQPTP